MKTSNLSSKAKKYLGRISALVLVISLNAFTVNEQTPFKSTTGSQIKVIGTSNIHDWTMNASSFVCEGNYILKGGQLQDITSLSFSLPVVNLKGKEDLLNSRAHKALKASEYSKITFKLTNAVVQSQQKTIKATGNLTIGGVTNPITFNSTYTLSGDEIICKGSKSIKMSEYGIKPPTFMLGALKVANEVTIDLAIKLKN
ncbi:MAG: YceI family protein [Pyrinomonadaceae bacterium]|nr:YceI family protein [Sphingobacteriaceae bacterium]